MRRSSTPTPRSRAASRRRSRRSRAPCSSNADKVAHDCKLTLEETGLQDLWRFGFDANVKNNGVTTTGGMTGSFMTRPNSQGGTGELSQSRCEPDHAQHAKDPKLLKGSKLLGKVTLLVTQPLSFKYSLRLRAARRGQGDSYDLRAVQEGRDRDADGLQIQRRTATLQVCGRNMIQGTGPPARASSSDAPTSRR